MKIRGVDLTYDRTNIDDTARFEDALADYQAEQKRMAETTYSRPSERLADGCEAAAKLLRTAFAIDMVEATGVNTRSLMDLTNLIVEITEAILAENKQDLQKVQRIASKYGNMRA